MKKLSERDEAAQLEAMKLSERMLSPDVGFIEDYAKKVAQLEEENEALHAFANAITLDVSPMSPMGRITRKIVELQEKLDADIASIR